MNAFRITGADRAWFKSCRRAWDLGAGVRQAYEPVDQPSPPTLPRAIGEALAVYYFPGMWDWQRDIVQPLVHQALDRAPGWDSTAADDRTLGHRVLDAYAAWAPSVDDFIPVRVLADIEADIPDPILSDRNLAAPDGAPVRLAGRLDALVVDTRGSIWLLCHRFGPFTDPELLAFDEPAVTNCWLWEQYALDRRVGGVIFNELSAGDGFRRTTVPVTREALELCGRHLALEALDMLQAGLALYPSPAPERCGTCPFRRPCRVMQDGHDPTSILQLAYRHRAPEKDVEGRLGAGTWSSGRGARPNRFGQGSF